MRILFEDPDVLIVEKPEDLPTQPLKNRKNDSLASLLVQKYPKLKKVGGSDWGAVHRLDVETSGLVAFARNQKTYERLREDFSKNRIEKEYTALVQGKIEKAGHIDWPIGSDPKSAKKVKVYKNIKEARRNKAQEAVTIYQTPSPYQGEGRGEVSLLRIHIKTGRRHQIRAHLAAISHPIVGDTTYGGPKAERLHLHASRLKFKHPRTGQWVEVVSEPAFSGSAREGA